MKDHSAPADDPWASLADELGVGDSPAPTPAPKPHPKEVRVEEARWEEPAAAPASAPELLDPPELLEDSEESDESDDSEDDGTPETPGIPGEPVKKRRRRRRRGKKKTEGDAVKVEGTDLAASAVTSEVGLSETESAPDDFPEAEGESFEEAESPETEEPHLAVALDEEMEADTNHEKPTWKVTSWKELVAGLHRPDR